MKKFVCYFNFFGSGLVAGLASAQAMEDRAWQFNAATAGVLLFVAVICANHSSK